MNLKNSIKIACLTSGVIFATAADASHFRGGALVPSVDANGLVSFTTTTFWRTTAVSGTTTEGGLSLNGSGVAKSNVTRVIDTSDSRFTRVVETYQVQLSSAGTNTFIWNSCCHVDGAANTNAGQAEALTSKITWDGSTANTPTFFNFSAINPEVIRGNVYNDSLGAVAGNGGTLTYDNALSEGIFPASTPAYTVTAAGELHITSAVTATMTHDNPIASNPGADYEFSGNIYNSDGSSIEFEWMWDAVDGGTNNNLAPVVNDMVLNVLQGDVLNATVTGSDPDGDPLTWSLLNFFGTGDNGLFTFDPVTQAIMWDTTGAGLGTYIANVRASDGSLTDVGTITINVLGSRVPEPGILALLGLGFTGLAFTRRRKNK